MSKVAIVFALLATTPSATLCRLCPSFALAWYACSCANGLSFVYVAVKHRVRIVSQHEYEGLTRIERIQDRNCKSCCCELDRWGTRYFLLLFCHRSTLNWSWRASADRAVLQACSYSSQLSVADKYVEDVQLR